MSNHRTKKAIALHHQQADSAAERHRARMEAQLKSAKEHRIEMQRQASAWIMCQFAAGFSFFLTIFSVIINALREVFR